MQLASEVVEGFDSRGFDTFPSLATIHNIDRAHVDRRLEIVGQPKASAVQADPQIDWDGLLDFIERLLPFILKILALFGLGI